MHMTDSLFLRIKSLNVRTMRGVTSTKSVIRVAAMHNLREIQAELGASAESGINPGRMALNYQLRGPDTAAGVADLALALLDNAGVTKLRRDACMALEVVFSLPPSSAVDHREFFSAAVAWADAFFNVPILSAAAHLDEAAPHCHVLLLPLVAGRMQGGALAGGPTKIKMMLSDFQQQVGQRFGLTHQPRAKRLSKTNRDQAGRMVLEALKARPELLKEPAIRDALIAALGQQHETLLPLLGLTLPAPSRTKAKTFAAIMTAPCKLERTTRARKCIDVAPPKCIDISHDRAGADPAKFDNVYLCVDVARPAAPIFPDEAQLQHPTADQRQPAASVQNSSQTTGPLQKTSVQSAIAECLKSDDRGTRTDHPQIDDATDRLNFEAVNSAISTTSTTADDFQRQRDDDQRAELWDEQRGEFVQATGPPPRAFHSHS
jgi:hypothetical protein